MPDELPDAFPHDEPIKTFLKNATAYRAVLNPEVTDGALAALVDTFVAGFKQITKVNPSRDQIAEYRTAEAAAIAAARVAEDATLEQRYAELHREYSAARATAEELPDAVGRAFQQMRENKETVVGMSRTELLLTRLVDFHESSSAEGKLVGKTFDQLDAIHEAAVARQDLGLQRVLERHWREKWPTVPRTPDGLAADLTAQRRLEARITAERATRVPAPVREGLAAIEKSWNEFQFKELRRIVRTQRFGIVG